MQRIGILLAADADLLPQRCCSAPPGCCGVRSASCPAAATRRRSTFMARSSWRMMTRQDPHSNLLRVALATMGAGLGGADHVTALPYHRGTRLADGFACRMARNTQTILLEESRLAAVADPTRGSGHVEALTAALVEKALAILDDIEASGGMLAALKSGKVQAMVAEAAASTAGGARSGRGVDHRRHALSASIERGRRRSRHAGDRRLARPL